MLDVVVSHAVGYRMLSSSAIAHVLPANDGSRLMQLYRRWQTFWHLNTWAVAMAASLSQGL